MEIHRNLLRPFFFTLFLAAITGVASRPAFTDPLDQSSIPLYTASCLSPVQTINQDHAACQVTSSFNNIMLRANCGVSENLGAFCFTAPKSDPCAYANRPGKPACCAAAGYLYNVTAVNSTAASLRWGNITASFSLGLPPGPGDANNDGRPIHTGPMPNPFHSYKDRTTIAAAGRAIREKYLRTQAVPSVSRITPSVYFPARHHSRGSTGRLHQGSIHSNTDGSGPGRSPGLTDGGHS
ncbi:hypothetical protein B0T26DRAFT_723557 [Lasiosphaeria miniovina]|uniref:Uncharacterized protein n=1 Tax=Lasiosphaeria miniovina TaxID=1954250 RepID=A0AA40A698_9PEZI|nr:uncharacterized protein B0T26DRAFT_723557 [Lasiosphaeria miniovina]KAK0709936.1 hypothetical protein B0T26DRAFT_723557 [Lasiosphaeria miniovina]